MRAILEVKHTRDLGDKGGHVDNLCFYLIRFLIISLINIIDLIISILFFDSNCIAFFVLKFIAIFIIFLMNLSSCYFYSYVFPKYTLAGCEPCCNSLISCIIVLGLEISLLVLFVKNCSSLNLIVQILFYVHYTPIIIIYIFQFFWLKQYLYAL